MDGYLSWDNQTITDFSDENVNAMYERGFVFTRTGRGVMTQTRSVRVDLSKFELTSENRRILKKTEGLTLEIIRLPHPDYDWHIHKLGHDFYETKFGKGTFSANKIKELLTGSESNYNRLFVYKYEGNQPQRGPFGIGYCVCYENRDWLHYSYPFYDLDAEIPNLGIGMMTKAIVWAKENGKKFVCLGSAKNSTAIYKTQFSGFEWFDGERWRVDITELKKVL
jgi:leucyl-tRNA---protein transferase